MDGQKMKIRVVSINLANIGSTGKIVENIRKIAQQDDIEVYIAYPPSDACNPKKDHDIIIGSKVGRYKSYQMAYYTGFNGCFSIFATLRFIQRLQKIRPDVIHLHNLHHSYINLPLLFGYIKKNAIPVVWTLHDCWAFTGQCPYFAMVKCNKWKSGCYECPSYTEYPESAVDRTSLMWKLKKKWFNGVQHMVIVTPSKWLANLVKESYLKDYPIKVINNGIDLSLFRPVQSNYRKEHNIAIDKYIVLGVAFGWGIRKGLDIFAELEKRLDPDIYQIVLVGTDGEVDKKLPPNIRTIHRTQNQQELVEIYTMADVFVNPTREDNFPTVNIESLACGTPVITFDTGGSPEILDNFCGKIVGVDDVDSMVREIEKQRKDKLLTSKNCIERSYCFSDTEKYMEYVEMYKKMAKKKEGLNEE